MRNSVQKRGGRPAIGRLLSTNKFRALVQKHGPEAIGIIRDIARHGEPDIVRFTAAKWLVERGFGENDGYSGYNGDSRTINVITGVGGRPAELDKSDGDNRALAILEKRLTERHSAPAMKHVVDIEPQKLDD